MGKGVLTVMMALGVALAGGCQSNRILQQRRIIQQQEQEMTRLRQEIANLHERLKKEAEEREACNRAFHHFEAARRASTAEAALLSYLEGLRICPNDDVAHNEVGELYLRSGRRTQAAAHLRRALEINPDFQRARQNLESLSGLP